MKHTIFGGALAVLGLMICAQAFPPSSGSYTHPSAISLSNGINSQDGGTFVGNVSVTGTIIADGGVLVSDTKKICLNAPLCTSYLNSSAGTVTLSGASQTALAGSGLTVVQNGEALFNWQVDGELKAVAASGDALIAASGGYTRALKSGAGAPASADCDAAGEAMRTYYDTTNHYHYVCEGAGGWYKSGVYAP